MADLQELIKAIADTKPFKVTETPVQHFCDELQKEMRRVQARRSYTFENTKARLLIHNVSEDNVAYLISQLLKLVEERGGTLEEIHRMSYNKYSCKARGYECYIYHKIVNRILGKTYEWADKKGLRA